MSYVRFDSLLASCAEFWCQGQCIGWSLSSSVFCVVFVCFAWSFILVRKAQFLFAGSVFSYIVYSFWFIWKSDAQYVACFRVTPLMMLCSPKCCLCCVAGAFWCCALILCVMIRACLGSRLFCLVGVVVWVVCDTCFWKHLQWVMADNCF